MDLNQNQKIAIVVVVFLLFMNVIFMPYLTRRKVKRIVKSILNSWEKDDYATPLHYWLEETKSPPIYGVESYTIDKVTFGKKDKKPYAKFLITLYLSMDNVLPSGKTWVCELLRTKNGWKIINFEIQIE